MEFNIRSNYAGWSIKKQLGWGLEIRLPGFKPQVHLSGGALTSIYLDLLITKMRIVTGPAPQGPYEDEMSSNGRSNWTSQDSSYTALWCLSLLGLIYQSAALPKVKERLCEC